MEQRNSMEQRGTLLSVYVKPKCVYINNLKKIL